MASQRAEAGDIVRVDIRGRIFFAEVEETEQEAKGRQLKYKINPIVKGITYYSCTSSNVREVYRKLGRRRGGGE